MVQVYEIEVDKFKSHQHSNGYSRYGAYKKKANKEYENDIIRQLKFTHMLDYDFNAYNSPVEVSFEICVKIPTTINKVRLKAKERELLSGKPANVKPDIANIIKTLEDCIERAGIIDDDKNITDYGSIKKRFVKDAKAKKEYCKITIKKLPN